MIANTISEQELPGAVSKMRLNDSSRVIIEEESQPTPAENNEQQLISVLVITWNMMGQLPKHAVVEALLGPSRKNNDLIVVGTQECQRSLLLSMCCTSKTTWEMMLAEQLETTHDLIDSETLNGIHIVAFLRKRLRGQLTLLPKSQIKTGMNGMSGNKGAVRLSFALGVKSFSFICTHLHARQCNTNHRNSNLIKILGELAPNDHSQEVFLFGDLNYRISLTKKEIDKYHSLINLRQYIQYDQLKQQVILDDFLREYKEGELNFAPTYKVRLEGEGYNPNRVPGWTDRIFYRSAGGSTRQLYYTSDSSIKGSDHYPVLACFQTTFTSTAETAGSLPRSRGNGCAIF